MREFMGKLGTAVVVACIMSCNTVVADDKLNTNRVLLTDSDLDSVAAGLAIYAQAAGPLLVLTNVNAQSYSDALVDFSGGFGLAFACCGETTTTSISSTSSPLLAPFHFQGAGISIRFTTYTSFSLN